MLGVLIHGGTGCEGFRLLGYRLLGVLVARGTGFSRYWLLENTPEHATPLCLATDMIWVVVLVVVVEVFESF